jgi:phenylalanyl-tRNA synthetase alpha subunit
MQTANPETHGSWTVVNHRFARVARLGGRQTHVARNVPDKYYIKQCEQYLSLDRSRVQRNNDVRKLVFKSRNRKAGQIFEEECGPEP